MVVFDYLTKIYYKDIDQMGLVYYARYFEFFEQARTELLNNMGISIAKFEAQGYFLPVVSAKCDYKKGMKLEDEIIVRTIIKNISGARLKINYEIYHSLDNCLLAIGETIHGFLNKKGVPRRPPKFFINKFISSTSD